MSKAYRPGRPTIGVLAGWQVYHGFVHSFLDGLFRGIRLAAEARECNLLLACGVTPSLHRPDCSDAAALGGAFG